MSKPSAEWVARILDISSSPPSGLWSINKHSPLTGPKQFPTIPTAAERKNRPNVWLSCSRFFSRYTVACANFIVAWNHRMHVIQFTWNFRVAISYCQNDRDLLQIQSTLAKQSSPNHFVKHHRKFGCIFSLWCTLLMRSWMRNPNERKDSMSLMESKPLETQNGHGFEVRLLEELQQSTNFSVGDFSDFF